MAKLRAIYTPSVAGTYFRVANAAGQFWSTVGAAFEAYNGANVNNYRVFATEVVSGAGVYEATTPAIQAGVYSVLFFDVLSSSDPLGAFDYVFDGTNEITLKTLNDDLGDVSLPVPVYTQVGTGEVLWQEITAYQFEAFGSYIFSVYDSQKPPQPINLTGHDLTFVCFDQDGTFRWQIINCPVSGAYSNIVTVADGDTNTSTAGNFRYALRDETTDKVLAIGRLIIEVAADSA